MLIGPDDLSGADIQALLEEHLRAMHALSPPESVHALDLSALRHPDISFWTARAGASLLGCGALKELDAHNAEVKSMRTAATHLRQGVARAMLVHLIAVARERGYSALWLETGSMAGFEPARRLYAQFGFRACEPYGTYVEDPQSVFMTLPLAPMRRLAGL